MDEKSEKPEAESAETKSGTARQAAGAGVGAGAGAFFGSKMGIAAFGTAVSARWPFAIVGGIIGWLACRRGSEENGRARAQGK